MLITIKDKESEITVKEVHKEKSEEPIKEEVSAETEVQEEIVEPAAKKLKMDTLSETNVDDVKNVEVEDVAEEKTQEKLVTADTTQENLVTADATQESSEKPVDESHQCEENGLKKVSSIF